MIQLVLIYCLADKPKECIEKRLAMENFPSPAACVSNAQARAVDYLREHPKYRLKSWRCEVNLPKQQPA